MFAFLELIPKWVWMAIVAALSATSCALHYENGQLTIDISKAATKVAQAEKREADTKTEHLALVAVSEKAHAASVEAHRVKEQELQTAMDTQRRKFNETTTALAANRDALRVRFESLRAATSVATGPTQVSVLGQAPSVGQTTGISPVPILSDPVGDLIDEATRADTIREALKLCYKTYDDAKAKLEGSSPPEPTESVSQP